MKNKLVAGFLLLIIALSGCSGETAPPESSASQSGSGTPTADTFLSHVLDAEYQEAYTMLDDAMKTFFVSETKLEEMWEETVAPLGEYSGHEEATITESGDVVVYTYPAQYATGAYHINISVSPDGFISGLSIVPVVSNESNLNAQARNGGTVASADLPDGVAEKDIIINKGEEHELYGKLTYPVDVTGSVPVVVLVHGSGAHDMDESMTEENKPFRDIAYALSQRGVAVYRYHKVTYAYPEDFDMATMTVDLETVNDAVKAKSALLEQGGMEFSGFYVAGHSLGGMMAPRIAQEGDYDGMILLAGSPRSLVDIMYDQNHYLVPLSGLPQDQVDATLAEVDRLYAEANEILELPVTELAGKTAFGLPALYLHSIANPAAEQTIRDLNLPMLILQGGKDFQVYADKDYALYEEITHGLNDVTMKKYDDLNHLFMPSFMDIPDTSEYKTPATVDENVLHDMAEWVLSRTGHS